MSYSYATFKTALAAEMVVEETDAEFIAVLPRIIAEAEARIYRELDLLSNVAISFRAFTANNRTLALPSAGTVFGVVSQVNILTAFSALITQGGDTFITQDGDTLVIQNQDEAARTPLVPASPEVVTMMWPSSVGAGTPTMFARQSDRTIIVGPWPSTALDVEIVGDANADLLSASNQTTWLATNLPDLFFAAAMERATAFQKNFGAQADNPQAATSWGARYLALRESVVIHEARKKFAAQGWSSAQPSPIATPARA